MPPGMTVTILAVACVAVLVAMLAGWRGRARRTAGYVPELPPVPADDAALGSPRTAPLEATYVSSTVAGDWLDRVVARDLGVRSRAVVRVFDVGVRIDRTGAQDLFIPSAALLGAGAGPGMAGKFVGREGLVILTWQAPGDGASALDTGLRLRHSPDRIVLIDAVRAILPTTPGVSPDDASPDDAAADDTSTTKEHQ